MRIASGPRSLRIHVRRSMRPLPRCRETRRGVAGLACAMVLVSATAGCERSTAADDIPQRLAALGRPNLVLIVVDTLRADWTSPYGFELDTSPELARWAERGALFERVRA